MGSFLVNKAGELGRHELGGTECPAKRQVAHYEGPGGWGVVPEGFLTVKSSIRSSPQELCLQVSAGIIAKRGFEVIQVWKR